MMLSDTCCGLPELTTLLMESAHLTVTVATPLVQVLLHRDHLVNYNSVATCVH